MNSTKIFVKDFKTETFVGIYPNEKQTKNPVIINVECEFINPKIQDDEIEFTFNYQGIIAEIKRMSDNHFNLVEKYAEHLCEFCLKHNSVKTVKVSIAKTDIFPDCHVGSIVTRSR